MVNIPINKPNKKKIFSRNSKVSIETTKLLVDHTEPGFENIIKALDKKIFIKSFFSEKEMIFNRLSNRKARIVSKQKIVTINLIVDSQIIQLSIKLNEPNKIKNKNIVSEMAEPKKLVNPAGIPCTINLRTEINELTFKDAPKAPPQKSPNKKGE
jgi:hypothetical protein